MILLKLSQTHTRVHTQTVSVEVLTSLKKRGSFSKAVTRGVCMLLVLFMQRDIKMAGLYWDLYTGHFDKYLLTIITKYMFCVPGQLLPQALR